MASADSSPGLGRLVGRSAAIRAVCEQIHSVASSDATVLLDGETGTGKQVAAESIHELSARGSGPFVTIDCGSLPAGVLESELFGHEKGAFTGADEPRIGAFAEASGGSVFLDEVGELPLALQPALLRALDKREVRRVGANRFVPVDVRVIAATNRDLRAEVSAGRFRSDLYFRLAVVQVHMPPLRARPDDIPALVARFTADARAPGRLRAELLSSTALSAMARAPWPGNVRELRNYIRRCVVFGQVLPLPGHLETTAEPAIDLRVSWSRARAAAIASFERRYLEALMKLYEGRVAPAAAHAGIDRVYLYKLLRRHGIGRKE